MKKRFYNTIIFSLYVILDFIAVTLAILFSYRIYRFLGIGKQVYYSESALIIASLASSSIAVLILFGLEAYKKESSVLNMEELKNVIQGITATFVNGREKVSHLWS